MKSEIPGLGWTHVGTSSNADFYEVEPDILAVVPHVNSRDDERTARESLAFQRQHWHGRGHRGAVVVYMDPVVEQDSGARAVYANETASLPSTCFALVGETFFGHAAAAVFTGLSKPGLPTQVFRSFDDARAWIVEMNRTRGGRL